MGHTWFSRSTVFGIWQSRCWNSWGPSQITLVTQIYRWLVTLRDLIQFFDNFVYRTVIHFILVSDNERCKLYCRVSGSAAFYLLKDKVLDGTPCYRHGDDMCIDGTCHKVPNFPNTDLVKKNLPIAIIAWFLKRYVLIIAIGWLRPSFGVRNATW